MDTDQPNKTLLNHSLDLVEDVYRIINHDVGHLSTKVKQCESHSCYYKVNENEIVTKHNIIGTLKDNLFELSRVIKAFVVVGGVIVFFLGVYGHIKGRMPNDNHLLMEKMISAFEIHNNLMEERK